MTTKCDQQAHTTTHVFLPGESRVAKGHNGGISALGIGQCPIPRKILEVFFKCGALVLLARTIPL